MWSLRHTPEAEVASIKCLGNSVGKVGSVVEALPRMGLSISSQVAMGKC